MMMSSKMIFNALFAVTLMIGIFACQKNSDLMTPNPAETNAFVPPTTSARLSNNLNQNQNPPAGTKRAIIIARRTDSYIEPQYQILFEEHNDWLAMCIDINLADIPVGNPFGLTIVPPASATSFTYTYNPVNCRENRDTNNISKILPPPCLTCCGAVCSVGKVLGFLSN
jgi:hypothetical protein